MNNSTAGKVPRVSIGLPVFNGEKYLEQSIQSILDQTFTDFELIICDNASTDRTGEICLHYAARDPRVRYERNTRNIGGANNHNLTFHRSRGEYFRWAAHDDVVAPKLLEKCVAVLDREPDVVLCHTAFIEIDEQGHHMKTTSRNSAASLQPYQRFAEIAIAKDFCEETYGLLRSEIFGKTRLQQNYTASDRTLLCELSLYGRFYNIDEPLFYKRFHPGNVYTDWRTRMAWFGSSYEGKIVFPFWNQFFDYFRTIRRVPLHPNEKIRCYAFMLGPWLWVYGKNMIKDLMVAAYMLVHSPRWRRERYANTNNWS